MPLTSGTKLGPYEILSPLGAGGMGEVYRARDARLNRDVAIKILPASFSTDPDRLQRFAQESRAAAALNHPNILSIYDIGEADIGQDHGAPYVVSELLEGETLRDRLRNGPLASRKAIDYAQQIARGLAAAHEKGIVHRDLKPENLFITNDGRAKILDFGLAKVTRPEADTSGDAPTQQVGTEAGTVMGTAGYMSPEQVRGKLADPRSDIFAFGAILYEMLSGKRAFHGDSNVDTMSAILKEEPPDLSETNRNVSPALERVVRHCIEKSPAERFQSARDVAFNLEALTDVSSSSRGGVRAIPEVPSARRWLMPVLGGLLLLASWAGVYRYARRGPAPTNPTFHEVTFRNGIIWDARFAPDGQTIIYGAAWDGAPQEIFSTRFDSSDSRSVGLPSAQVLAISSKGEMAISLHPVNSTPFTQAGTLARVPLAGGAPREVIENVLWADWTPDGQSLAVIRPHSSGTAHLEFPVGNVLYEPKGWVSHIRFSPDGNYIAVGDHVGGGDDGRVVILDSHGNRKVSSSFYSSVEGLAWAPSGNEVWFSAVPAGSARSIYALDLSGKERLIYRSPGGLTIHDISRTGLVLLTADKARLGISALPPGETRERSLSWFDWSLLADMSPDGKTIIFSETGEAAAGNYSMFLRKTDGSAAVRLGEGGFGALSPDGLWVVASVGSPAKLVLLPTGVGEPRQLTDDKVDHFNLAWMPDSKSVIYSAAEPGHAPRSYMLDIQGGAPRALTPENSAGSLISPDGKFLLAMDGNRQRWLYPTAGGDPQKVEVAFNPNERAMGFSADGKSLLLRTVTIPVQITRVDLATGKREPWKQIVPADPAGVQSIPVIKFSADGKSYAYSVGRILSDLYVVDGLK
ncbi:MAG TPA: protein kinase [Candidatus Sulfotelmatobacter sp.]|nr:protein kinase [Candidatus Sulfotelmatobacter sp.]